MNTVYIFANKAARNSRPVNLKTWMLEINGVLHPATGIDVRCASYTWPRPEEGIRSEWKICCHPTTITWQDDYCILE